MTKPKTAKPDRRRATGDASHDRGAPSSEPRSSSLGSETPRADGARGHTSGLRATPETGANARELSKRAPTSNGGAP
ncbi:MAG: hypothetical protein U0414_31450 [Polyangiaceae bacterium]